MSNIYQFPAMPEKSGSFLAESTPDGVHNGARLIGY